MRDWHGLVKVLEIQHLGKNKEVLWEAKNLRNMLHTVGEAFVLNALFLGGNNPNSYIPNNYYFGLDARTSLLASDTMTTISNSQEPGAHGYSRQLVSSTGQFSLVTIEGVYQANSPIITFAAAGGSWGPVSNLFMTDQAGNAGNLIASVLLSQPITVNDGESITMRMGLALQDLPSS